MTRSLSFAAVLASFAPLISGCDTALVLDCNNLGSSEDAEKVAAFLDTAARFETDANLLVDGVDDTCRALASDLGLTVPEPAANELPVEASCDVVSAEIEAIVANAEATLELEYVPPVCSIDVDAYADCLVDCDASLEANIDVECTEGRVVGGCSGTCSGECRVEGTVACEAFCDGQCTGSCSGNCYGECNGTCSAVDARDGSCVGSCDGQCRGYCEADCSGSCMGTCIADVEASCAGQCAGSCDVEWEAPRCEGEVDVDADVDCEVACETEIRAEAECTEPEIAIHLSAVGADADALARLDVLLGSLGEHYPRLLQLSAQLADVVSAGAELSSAFDGAARAAGRLGLGGSACFTEASVRALDALARVEVTVSVTVEVSASVE